MEFQVLFVINDMHRHETTVFWFQPKPKYLFFPKAWDV